MSIRSILMVMLALVFGGSAAIGVKMVMNQQAMAAPKPETVPVVVAVASIPRGEMITADLVRVRDFPKDLVPVGALATVEEAMERAVLGPLVAEEPILEGKLAPKGAGRGLSAVIPKGMRAFTIQTPNVASGVAGFILPGNLVDVLLTVTDSMDSDTGGASTSTLLQRVEILAVDQQMDAPAENRVDAQQLRSVTLLVTPHQAAVLDLGQNKGKLHLSLRNAEDDDAAEVEMVTLNRLRGRQEKPLPVLEPEILVEAAPTPTPPPVPIVEAPQPEPPKRVIIYHGRRQAVPYTFGRAGADEIDPFVVQQLNQVLNAEPLTNNRSADR